MSVMLTNIGHRFAGGPWLFQGIDLVLDPGRVYALVGPSGSGKSTLLSIIAGLEKPTRGSIQLPTGASVIWVFQNPLGSPWRSVLDHIMLPYLARGCNLSDAKERSLELLRRFHLERKADSAFRDLSGGEAQRLMLARGLAASPDVLLVDEPTAQLDLRTARTVHDVIGGLADNDVAVVVATHDAETMRACTETIDLADYSGVEGEK